MVSCVSCRDNDDDALPNGFLRKFVDCALGTGNVFVTAERNVQHPNVQAFAVFENPAKSLSNVLFTDPSVLANFHQHESRVRSNAAIFPVAEVTISCRSYGSLCPMPMPRLNQSRRSSFCLFTADIVKSHEAVVRLDKIGVSMESRIKESDGDASTRK